MLLSSFLGRSSMLGAQSATVLLIGRNDAAAVHGSAQHHRRVGGTCQISATLHSGRSPNISCPDIDLQWEDVGCGTSAAITVGFFWLEQTGDRSSFQGRHRRSPHE
jgi:hypothetical protein